MCERILMAWSGGKDSAMALHELKRAGGYEIAALLTTVTQGYDRVSMHGVRRVLLERQAEALGLPLHTVFIPPTCRNADYELRMKEALGVHQQHGIRKVAFGDIFLEDVRAYRERNLALAGMQGLFPIWKRDTRELVREFIAFGFQAVVVCADSKVLGPSFAGQPIAEEFLERLPPGIDPCGENGEFHSFVFDGPLFRGPVRWSRGEVVARDGFYFCDLIPA